MLLDDAYMNLAIAEKSEIRKMIEKIWGRAQDLLFPNPPYPK